MRIRDWSSDVCSSDLGLVLQNEAIATDTEVRPDDRTRADVGGKPVSGRLRAMVLVLAEPVQPVIGERDVHARLVRRKALLNLAEGQEGQSVEAVRVDIAVVARVGDYLPVADVPEIETGQ